MKKIFLVLVIGIMSIGLFAGNFQQGTNRQNQNATFGRNAVNYGNQNMIQRKDAIGNYANQNMMMGKGTTGIYANQNALRGKNTEKSELSQNYLELLTEKYLPERLEELKSYFDNEVTLKTTVQENASEIRQKITEEYQTALKDNPTLTLREFVSGLDLPYMERIGQNSSNLYSDLSTAVEYDNDQLIKDVLTKIIDSVKDRHEEMNEEIEKIQEFLNK